MRGKRTASPDLWRVDGAIPSIPLEDVDRLDGADGSESLGLWRRIQRPVRRSPRRTDPNTLWLRARALHAARQQCVVGEQTGPPPLPGCAVEEYPASIVTIDLHFHSHAPPPGRYKRAPRFSMSLQPGASAILRATTRAPPRCRCNLFRRTQDRRDAATVAAFSTVSIRARRSRSGSSRYHVPPLEEIVGHEDDGDIPVASRAPATASDALLEIRKRPRPPSRNASTSPVRGRRHPAARVRQRQSPETAP